MRAKNLYPHSFNTSGYDSKKIAYTMLTSGLFTKCECTAVNNDPKEFDNEYVFPRDLYVGDTITDNNVGTYTSFVKSLGKNRDNILQCTCALDESDNERVTFMGIGANEGLINFLTFIDSKHNPQELLESLIDKYNENF